MSVETRHLASAACRAQLLAEHPENCPVCGTPVSSQDEESPCPKCGHLLWFTSHRVGEVTVVQLVDSRSAVLELLDLLDHAILDGAVGKIVLDFGGIQQVSSAALGKLVKLSSRAQAARGRIALCGLHPDLRHVLQITRLDVLFETHDTESQALASLGVCCA
ncbi:MAG: STAS domain-containing protein [Isosphaeraceae bacterium]